MGTRLSNTDGLTFKPAKNKSLAKAAKLAKKPAFDFKVGKKACLHSTDVKLKHGGLVKVKVERNNKESGKIIRKSKPQEETDKQWNCSITQWSGEVHTKDPVILNTNFNAIYPGAVYAYESIASGSYETLPYARKPLSINVDGVHFNKAAINVKEPSKSTVRQAIADIVKTKSQGGGARTFGQKFEVLSEEDLFIRTGGSGYFLGFGGSNDVDYKSKSKTYKYFMEIYQSYYTISVNDNVHEPGDFFFTKEEHPNMKDAVAAKAMDPNWVYVDSLTYGRVFQVMFQSDESFSSVGIDVEAHANLLVGGGEGSFNMDQQNLLKNTTIEIVAIGGKPDDSGKVLNVSSPEELKRRIDTYFTGADDEQPIAYTLKTLDGDIVGASMMTDFTSRQCSPRASKYAVTWDDIICVRSDDNSGGEEVRAMVRIRAFKGNGEDILDEAKINQPILMLNQAKQSGLAIPLPWTFVKGSEDTPINLNQSESYRFDKKIIFEVDKNDDNAKLAIRADILEYDDGPNPNDDFTDALWEKKISELTGKDHVILICSDDDSRIKFNFTVTPVYG